VPKKQVRPRSHLSPDRACVAALWSLRPEGNRELRKFLGDLQRSCLLLNLRSVDEQTVNDEGRKEQPAQRGQTDSLPAGWCGIEFGTTGWRPTIPIVLSALIMSKVLTAPGQAGINGEIKYERQRNNQAISWARHAFASVTASLIVPS
jgi:hypothetical protein